MIDVRPTPLYRGALVFGGAALIVAGTVAWIQSPSAGNGLFLGAGMVLGWAMLSRSRSRLVLFEHQGLYWDGFRHVLLERRHCVASMGPHGLTVAMGPGDHHPTIALSHLNPEKASTVAGWCRITSSGENSNGGPQAPGCC